jgi:hypothetical protein
MVCSLGQYGLGIFCADDNYITTQLQPLHKREIKNILFENELILEGFHSKK